MEAYTGFAGDYDEYMEDLPYGLWVDYIEGMLELYGIRDGLVCELGCGTGTATEMLADRGFDMIGVDLSEDMLAIAQEKQKEPGRILYLNQDMREFELYGTVRAIVSVGDSMNYITDPDDLLKVFKLVNNYLDPDGVFIFDLKTEYLFKNVMGENTRFLDYEDVSLVWENHYDEETKINEYALTGFRLTDEAEDIYQRFDEIHEQRAYSISEVRALLKKAGLCCDGVFELQEEKDGWSTAAAGKKTERYHFVCTKK